jgi:hypothetical protein
MPLPPQLPSGFSFLSPACRPTPQEVDTYASIIAAVEGADAPAEERRREAELQLWIWRNEMRPRSSRRRAAPPAEGARAERHS